MSLTENSFIVPFSLTGISNFNGTLNGNVAVGGIIVSGQTAYLSSSAIDTNGNIGLDLHIPTATGSITGLLSSTDFNIFNNKLNNILPLNNTFSGVNTFSNSDFKLSGITSNTTIYCLYYNFSTKSITYGVAPAGANLLNSDNTWTAPNNFTNAIFKVSLQSDAGDEMVVINNTTKQFYRTTKPNVNSLLSTINNWTASNTFGGNLTVNSPFVTTLNGQMKYAAPSAIPTANCLYWDATTNLITRGAIPNVNSLLTTINTFTQNNTFSSNLTVGLVSTFSGSIVASNLLNASGNKSVFWDSTTKQLSQQESYLTRANIFAGNNRFNGTTYFNNATNTFANMPLTSNTTYIVCRNISTGNLEYGIKGSAVPFSLAVPLYLDNTTGLINLGIDANLMMVDASNKLTIKKSTTLQDGYLSATDFNTFNNKEAVLTFSYPLSRAGNTITTPNLNISSSTKSNSFIGFNVGNSTNTGTFNTFIGIGLGFNLTSGTTNVGIGSNTLTALTSGGYNIGIGNSVLLGLTTGSDNCCIGGLAEGQAITTGSQNTLINCQNLALTTGVKNIIIGRGNSSASTNLQSFTLIGSNNSYELCDYSFLSGYGNRIKGFYNVIIGANNQSTQSGGVFPSLLYNNTIGYNNLTNHTDCNVFGSNMTTQANNSTYVNNIRNVTNTMMLSYNTTTKEITYEAKSSGGVSLSGNNIWTGYNKFQASDSYNNVSFGTLAMDTVSGTGMNNIAIGTNALQYSSGGNNMYFGYRSGWNNFGNSSNICIGIGMYSGYYAGSQYGCVGLGYNTSYAGAFNAFSNVLHISSGTNYTEPTASNTVQWVNNWRNFSTGYYCSTNTANEMGYAYSGYLSDERCKKNIKGACKIKSKSVLQSIQIKNFDYKDNLHSNITIGVVADDLIKCPNLNQCIHQAGTYIPSIQKRCQFKIVEILVPFTHPKYPEGLDNKDVRKNKARVANGELVLEQFIDIYIDTTKYNYVVGDWLRYDSNEMKTSSDINHQLDIFHVDKDFYRLKNVDGITNAKFPNGVFLYGGWHDDVNHVKHEPLLYHTINTVQELIKENDDLKLRVAKLEATLEKVLLRLEQ